LTGRGSDASQALGAAIEAYRGALRLRPDALDAKWNYELANRKRGGGGGGGGGSGSSNASANPQPGGESPPKPSSGLDQRQAEQILNSAERDERDVQARKQRETQPTPPPGGKDW
jgi:hypothetical protein